jgi:predicted GNAT superfamily acetyltransferase
LIGAYKENGGLRNALDLFSDFGFLFYTGWSTSKCIVRYAGGIAEYRDQGLGYKLKRAQWQMVRNQGLDRIIWTFDPLMSRNAYLNIHKLGAVCNTYLRNFYGEISRY